MAKHAVRIEHWPEHRSMAVMLTEVPEGAMRTFSEEVSPGVIFSYAETPEGCVLTAIEVESGPDRDLSRVEFESLREMPQDA